MKIQQENAPTNENVYESDFLLTDSFREELQANIILDDGDCIQFKNKDDFQGFKRQLLEILEASSPPTLSLEKGHTPDVEHTPTAYFTFVGRYTHTRLPRDWYRFFPDEKTIREERSYQSIKNSETIISEERTREFLTNCKAIEPTREQYRDFLVSVCRKLMFFGNTADSIFSALRYYTLVRKDGMNHFFSDEILEDVIDEAVHRGYSPREKVVVFNPMYSAHTTFLFKKRIQQEQRKKYLETILDKYKGKPITLKELATESGFSVGAISSFKKQLGIQFLSKEADASQKIQSFQHIYPNATMKACADHFGKSRHWVKPHWTKPPSKAERVTEWRRENPNGLQEECQKELGFGIATIKRNWNK